MNGRITDGRHTQSHYGQITRSSIPTYRRIRDIASDVEGKSVNGYQSLIFNAVIRGQACLMTSRAITNSQEGSK